VTQAQCFKLDAIISLPIHVGSKAFNRHSASLCPYAVNTLYDGCYSKTRWSGCKQGTGSPTRPLVPWAVTTLLPHPRPSGNSTLLTLTTDKQSLKNLPNIFMVLSVCNTEKQHSTVGRTVAVVVPVHLHSHLNVQAFITEHLKIKWWLTAGI
jgi:hypothetical protein